MGTNISLKRIPKRYKWSGKKNSKKVKKVSYSQCLVALQPFSENGEISSNIIQGSVPVFSMQNHYIKLSDLTVDVPSNTVTFYTHHFTTLFM